MRMHDDTVAPHTDGYTTTTRPTPVQHVLLGHHQRLQGHSLPEGRGLEVGVHVLVLLQEEADAAPL